tara:strand:+ start:293 stop:502 length:210 start_codon:yes stop_codon:yes gene_type:complete
MRKFLQIAKPRTLIHFQKGNYVYRYVLVDRYEVTKTHHNGFDDKEHLTMEEMFELATPRKIRRKYIPKK